VHVQTVCEAVGGAGLDLVEFAPEAQAIRVVICLRPVCVCVCVRESVCVCK